MPSICYIHNIPKWWVKWTLKNNEYLALSWLGIINPEASDDNQTRSWPHFNFKPLLHNTDQKILRFAEEMRNPAGHSSTRNTMYDVVQLMGIIPLT